MDKDTLTNLIADPKSISEHDLENLEEIVATYPYCQVAHILIAKYTQDNESMLAPQKVRKAASYAFDRNLLRKFIHGNLNIQSQPEATEKTSIPIPETKTDQEEENSNLDLEETATIEDAEIDNSNSFFDNIEDTTPSNDISESKALALYHDGKVEEASQMYEDLSLQYPDKEQYYLKQRNILLGNKIENTSDLNSSNETESIEDNTPTESRAMNLHMESKEKESLQMYKQLIDLNPDLQDYYLQQMDVIASEENRAYVEEVKTNLKFKQAQQEASTNQNTSIPENLEQTPPDSISESLVLESEEGSTENQSFFESVESEESSTENQSFFESVESEENAESENETQPELAVASFFDDIEGIEDTEKSQEQNTAQDDIESEILQAFLEYEPQSEIEHFDDLYEKYQDYNNSSENSENALQNTNTDQASDPPKQLEIVEPEENNTLPKEENPQPSESEAIMYFNQGQYQKALDIYDELIIQNPQKASYFMGQINILKDSMQENQSKTSEEEEADVELRQTQNEEDNMDFYTSEEDNSLSEKSAIMLFNQGKTQAAIDIYEQLILKFPDKKAYFASQIEILKS